ncbi:MAG: aminoglycoside phosphotransferase family protein [Eubacteriales bacterium]|nr:aminoglycoside phosphotransferase family protein [Eubacteriales bacterium]
MPLFDKTIRDWDDWGGIFRDAEAFAPLIRAIYAREGIACRPPERCKPGTNAVFAVGETVVKLFVPRETGYDAREDYEAERHGLSRANALGIPAPALLAAGEWEDRYFWRYLITARVRGTEYGDLALCAGQRRALGRALRGITDRLNVPEAENPAFLRRARENTGWEELGFSASFREERLAFLDAYAPPPFVWCHADITPENLMLTQDGAPVLIDFADAHPAPQAAEHAIVAAELFRFDRAGLEGFFGEDFSPERLAEVCMEGLLTHDFGANVIADRFGTDFPGLAALRRALTGALETG